MNGNKLSLKELEAGLDFILQSPRDAGQLKLIVRRPGAGRRELLKEADLDIDVGLDGDDWINRETAKAKNGKVSTDSQITIMNSRAIGLIAVKKHRWALAGDQLYVDLDLSDENLPPGSRLGIGEAVVEITPAPHTGCRAFADRFGVDALKFVNSVEGRKLNLRGVNTKIVTPGTIKVGDTVEKIGN